MQIAYFDESGDDGFPLYSSPLFVLTAVYLHHLNWKECYQAIYDFRKDLKQSFDFPVKLEMHSRYFLLNKKPYRNLSISEQDRLKIFELYCEMIASLNIKIVNVVIVKPRIKNQDYVVLDRALTYSVQRIENDLNPTLNPNEKFMIITDPGRVGTMRKTTRKVQKINFIPSRFSPQSYRKEITALIEDPLPKDSKESYFIQIADLVAYIVYLYGLRKTKVGGFSNRLSIFLKEKHVKNWMEKLKPSLNLNASTADNFGVVFYPK